MPRLVDPDPPGLTRIVTRADALSSGLTPGRIGWLVASGRWTLLTRGVYLRAWEQPSVLSSHEAADALHVARALAAANSRPGSVLARSSAAIVHGLPLVSGTPSAVELAVPRAARRELRAGVRSRCTFVPAGDIVMVEADGLGPLPVTSIARTWVDVARHHPLADALSVGDAALREGRMSLDEARECLIRIGPGRGVRRAMLALPLLDARRESPLESGSAARFIQWSFPAPRLQHTFYDSHGVPIARSDFDWPDHGVIGFADGMGKYGIDPRRDRAERRQEARLRPHGIVVRWGWSDMAGTGTSLFTALAPLLGFTGPMRPATSWM